MCAFQNLLFPVTGRPNLHLKCILDGGVNGTFIVRRKQLTSSLRIVSQNVDTFTVTQQKLRYLRYLQSVTYQKVLIERSLSYVSLLH